QSPRPPRSTPFPYTTLFRSVFKDDVGGHLLHRVAHGAQLRHDILAWAAFLQHALNAAGLALDPLQPVHKLLDHFRVLNRGRQFADRKSTRLNSSHVKISYAV